MPKHKPSLESQVFFSSVRWKAFSSYEFAELPSGEIIRPSGIESSDKRFDTEDRQISLLRDWIKIGRQKGRAAQRKAVSQFAEQNGLPFGNDSESEYVHVIIEAAQYIAFLYDVAFELHAPVPSLERLIAERPVSEDYARVIAGNLVKRKYQVLVARTPAEIGSCLNASEAEKYFLREFSAIRRDWLSIEPVEKITAFFSNSSGEPIPVDAASAPLLQLWPIINKSQADWIHSQNNFLAVAGRELLRAAFCDARPGLSGLMEGITPSLEWTQSVAGGNVLLPKMRCKTPWQAICVALFNFAAGTSGFKRCPNPRCSIGLYSDANRSDSRNCGSSACRRWCSRNLPRIRKPATERRKK